MHSPHRITATISLVLPYEKAPPMRGFVIRLFVADYYRTKLINEPLTGLNILNIPEFDDSRLRFLITSTKMQFYFNVVSIKQTH